MRTDVKTDEIRAMGFSEETVQAWIAADTQILIELTEEDYQTFQRQAKPDALERLKFVKLGEVYYTAISVLEMDLLYLIHVAEGIDSVAKTLIFACSISPKEYLDAKTSRLQ